MIKRMEKLNSLLNLVDYNKLWEGFKKTKYAIYNHANFYINDKSGIGLDLIKKDSFFMGKVDEKFIGNTAISINNEYIAIWDEKYIYENMDNRKLASLIIHEMFHCFQLSSNEKRFPNELLGIEYPITIENISLRMLERKHLLDAYLEKDKDKKIELLTLYYNVRDKRESIIGRKIDYEKSIESVEGTAVYVEFKALNQLSAGNEKMMLEEYIEGFTNINEDNLKIRLSTFNQGLLLCLIADEYILGWHKEFFNSEKLLSDFIRENLDIKNIEVNYKNENLSEIKMYINNREKKIDSLFDDFDQERNLNILEGNLQITGFDPMNIIKRNKEMIHQNFLRVKIDGNEQVIKGPVKVTIGNGFFDVKQIEW